MEPIPLTLEPEEEIEKPKEIKILSLISDINNNYDIEYYLSGNKIIFEGRTKDIIPQRKYRKIYSVTEIQKNKYFTIFENIKEIYEEINNKINERNKEVKIIEKKNSILLSIPLNTTIIKECCFEIDEIILNVNNKIKDIYTYINTLIKKIDNLEEKNKYLESKNKNLEKKIDDIYLLLNNKEQIEKELNIMENRNEPNQKQINFSIVRTTHPGIKCNRCGMLPITGLRYECSICKDYNLCNICEEINSKIKTHPHNFIKIRNREIKPGDKEKKEEGMKNNKILYKCELLDKKPDNFSQTIFIEDEQNAIFEFNILNTCEFDFPGNGRTRLIEDTNKSQIKLNDIIIENEKGLKYGEKAKINITISNKNIQKINLGKNNICLILNINGQNIGNPINLNLIFKSKKVEEFRDEFNLDEKEYSDKILYEILQRNNFDLAQSFTYLFDM